MQLSKRHNTESVLYCFTYGSKIFIQLIKDDLKIVLLSFPLSLDSTPRYTGGVSKKNLQSGTELILCFNSLFFVLCLQLGISATQQDFN